MTAPLPATLVTGAANRIGKAISLDLAANGAPVVVHYNRSSEAADAVVADIRAQGGVATAVSENLLSLADANAFIAHCADTIGAPIGCVVNNASLFDKDELGSLGAELFVKHFAIHATAPALLADAMVQALPEAGEGLVVNIIDQRVWRLTPHFPSYTASKVALWSLTQTLAQGYAELTGGRVRVNAIGPGPTIANDRQQPEDFAAQVNGVPLKRGAELGDFGATIRYMWAMKSLTGQMIALDGGQHLAWQTPDVMNANE